MDLVIWRDVPVVIRVRGRREWAEVPVMRWNDTTQKIEAVVNTRGWAYAHRKDDRYRKEGR